MNKRLKSGKLALLLTAIAIVASGCVWYGPGPGPHRRYWHERYHDGGGWHPGYYDNGR